MTKAGRVDVAGESAAGEFDDGGSALVESATGESTTACVGAEVEVSGVAFFPGSHGELRRSSIDLCLQCLKRNI
jgi:hypothetical protein